MSEGVIVLSSQLAIIGSFLILISIYSVVSIISMIGLAISKLPVAVGLILSIIASFHILLAANRLEGVNKMKRIGVRYG